MIFQARWVGRLGAGSTVLFASLYLVLPPVGAWPSVCDNCWSGINPMTEEIDHQCCLDGWHCEHLAELGYWPVATNLEWCVSSPDSCTVQDGCSAGGEGGGGGSGCHVPYGQLCPAMCFSCAYFYF